ncbi:MAG: pyruvate ferredoxin oxidoreductase, partial [Planctomycetota bacterium]
MGPVTTDKKPKVMILTGNQASAYAAYLARTQVIAAYPITPQTTIIETLAELMAGAKWENRFVCVESEHSAMAACIGASLVGARTFTATSSQGLALMHELLHWASGARLPIVMVNVNRAMAPGWNIWSDQNDSLSQRDTGWMQIYCESPQEALDSILLAFKVAELHHIPAMIVLDAFVLSHTAEPVTLPNEDILAEWLPPRKPLFSMDTKNPAAFGGLVLPEPYMMFRHQLELDMQKALGTLKEFDKDYQRLFARGYGLVE